ESDQIQDDTAGKDHGARKQKVYFCYGTKSLTEPAEKVTDASVKKGIQIKLGSQKPIQHSCAVKSQSSAAAAALNLDEEEEPEEMLPEARMRLRNIGRETPTLAGPNSFVFVLSGRGLCDGPIPRPEESYRLWCVFECDQVKIKTLYTYCEQKLKVNKTAVLKEDWNGKRLPRNRVGFVMEIIKEKIRTLKKSETRGP
ncbi:hypothetical protein Cfor_06988, partial [Coptotermes formosanus]